MKIFIIFKPIVVDEIFKIYNRKALILRVFELKIMERERRIFEWLDIYY